MMEETIFLNQKTNNTAVMKNILLISGLSLFILACNEPGNKSAIQKSNKYDSLLTSVDTYLQSYVDSGFSGVALIADSNGIIFHKAYNANGDNIDTSAGFAIASNAKELTGIAIMQLYERGKLSINDSITKYFTNVPADKRYITIHHLLTHTSGLDECECVDGEIDKQKIIEGIFHTKMVHPAGGKWVYRSENYILLAYIIEKASKMTYRDYVQQNILDVAGMNHTGQSGQEKEKSVSMAPFTIDSLKEMPVYKKNYSNGILRTDLAGHKIGAYFSTTGDMYKLTSAIGRNKLISDSTLTIATNPQTSGVIRNKDTAIYYGDGLLYTMTKGKRINILSSGREDWLMNSRVYILENGYTIIVWSRDFSGPEADAVASTLSLKLVDIFENLK